MPALTVFRNFTTKPLAGDDFQIVCVVLGTYRVVQLCCIIPLVIQWFLERYSGEDLVINGYSDWCPQWQGNNVTNFLVMTASEFEDDEEIETRRFRFSRLFIILVLVFTGLDLAWILAAWGAATMGTPTQPMGRDEYLRWLIVGKMFSTFFLVAIVVLGCRGIHQLRRNNYGCGEKTPEYKPDQQWYYVLYSILLVTYFLEFAVWPSIFVNKLMRWIRSNQLTQKRRYATKAKGERLEQCLGGLLKCLSVVCCNKSGGKELKNQGEMKDFASNLMEFANNESKIGVVLSDMYVGGKLLARVQAERRMRAIQMLQLSSNSKNDEADEPAGEKLLSSSAPTDRRALLDSERRCRSILTLQTQEDGKHFVVTEKHVLTSSNAADADALRNAAHYSIYAMYVYWHIRPVLENASGVNLLSDATRFVHDLDMMAPVEELSLAVYDDPRKHIFYANFQNGLAATPYAILVDEEERSVVITVRGTISLEDWVIDLQYVPQPLDKVGDVCGFDGKGHHCHKGVLTRGKWLYNDIKKQRVLKHLYTSSNSPYKEYALVVVGHSLGGGCAQVLSLMLRPSFPSLRCYAYEPPGCIFDDLLSEDCKAWITSVVRHEDVVPRVTQPNLESLRDEFFDVLARIKVPKIKAFNDVRSPCPESHLALRNARILCPKGEIDPTTEYSQNVRKLRNERAAKNRTGEVSTKLYIPGQIIHLVDTVGDGSKYIPYWASRYQFNQVILSKRMLADHSVPPLVEILRKLNTNLDDVVHDVHTWHTSDDDEDEDVEDENSETLMFVPFSNPQGRKPLILIVFAVLAVIVSSLSNRGCRYVSRSNVFSYPNGTSHVGPRSSLGLWLYNLKQCIDAESCNANDPNDLVDSNNCLVYDKLFGNVDIYWKSARAFGTLSTLLVCTSLGLISTATCTKLKKRTWIVLVALFLLATLFQGLQFLFLKSELCNVWTHPDTSVILKSECSLSTEGNYGIAAAVFSFILAVGCSHMARQAIH